MGSPRLTRRVRRLSDDPHVELTPMIDVVFLLLTFFVFSIVLMIRADVLDVKLPELTSGQNAEHVTPITIAISQDGTLHLNSDPIELTAIAQRVRALREDQPDAPLLLAVDVQSDAGTMIELADTLVGAGLGDFSIVGRQSKSDEPPDSEPKPGDQP